LLTDNSGGFVKEADDAEVRLYTYTAELFKAHEKLLTDDHRNRAFYRALEKHVTPESVVLDIGSGTGIWAIAAAMLGAKRVVAVERDPLLIGLIRSLAKANGVDDRVEAIASESRQVQLDREFDIVVSEMIGHLALEEEIIPILTDARDRLLKPGGVLIPQNVALVTAGAHLKARHDRMPAGVSVNYELFNSMNLNTPLGLEDRTRLKLLTEPRELASTDLMSVMTMPDLTDMAGRWTVADTSEINCFAVWVESTLADGVEMTTLLATSWEPLIYRVKPFAGKRGEIEFKLSLTPVSNYWSVTLKSELETEEQSYSPAYVGPLLLAQSRTDDDLLSSGQRILFSGASRI